MKLAITTTEPTMDASVDLRFGRAAHIMIYDTEAGQGTVLNREENPMHSAGIKTAQDIINAEVEAVITGHVGPNAFRTLQVANIQVFTVDEMTAQQAIEQYQQGKLASLNQADKPGHWQ